MSFVASTAIHTEPFQPRLLAAALTEVDRCIAKSMSDEVPHVPSSSYCLARLKKAQEEVTSPFKSRSPE